MDRAIMLAEKMRPTVPPGRGISGEREEEEKALCEAMAAHTFLDVRGTPLGCEAEVPLVKKMLEMRSGRSRTC